MVFHLQNVIFLTCDAFGVLPPIARLTPSQAAYHFISGYTAKVAGTEIGVKEPQATFSACFGEPFMPMHPGVYADLLSAKWTSTDRAWLINTGWSGGAYGEGSRMKIKYTRTVLTAALDGDLDDVAFVVDGRFGFEVPTSCPGVPSDVLQPSSLVRWSGLRRHGRQIGLDVQRELQAVRSRCVSRSQRSSTCTLA